MASIKKGPTSIRVFICKNGVRETKTFELGLGQTKVARDWAAAREAEIAADTKLARGAKHTGVELVDAWIKEMLPTRPSWEWELSRLTWLKANVPALARPMRLWEMEDWDEWVAIRSGQVSGATVRRELQLLGPVLTWGVTKKRWLDRNYIRLIDWPANNKARKMRISDEEAGRVIDALGYTRGATPLSKRERLAWAFLMAIEVGMRRGELLKTEWKNVHPTHIHLPAEICKNGHERDVPFTPGAEELMRVMVREKGALLLAGLNANDCDVLFREARTTAGLPELHFHDTRHEAVTRLARRLDQMDLGGMIGHRDPRSLATYYNPTPAEIRDRLADQDSRTAPPSR